MRAALISLVAVTLGGCASVSSVSPALSQMDNVLIVPGDNGYQYVEKVSYKFDGTIAKEDALALCIAQNVQNNSVTLQDSSNRTFIPYVGTVSNTTARDVGGGQVLKYVSEDRKSILADGVVPYQYDFLAISVKEFARFSLAAKAAKDSLLIDFTNVEHAQVDTGVSANDGYSKLGAWPGQHPEVVVGVLQKIASRINDCVKTQ